MGITRTWRRKLTAFCSAVSHITAFCADSNMTNRFKIPQAIHVHVLHKCLGCWRENFINGCIVPELVSSSTFMIPVDGFQCTSLINNFLWGQKLTALASSMASACIWSSLVAERHCR